jgi:Pentapeptide repeats (8 copies)
MSDQDNGQVSTLLRPTTNAPEAWRAYWNAQGWPWRTEPEIDAERKKYLTERRTIVPDIEKGIYPFKDVEPKLTRADIEWLLATHENGRGPVEWSDESQHEPEGLDLRGANLSQEDLSGLPLACMKGGLRPRIHTRANGKQRNMAAVCMKKADLRGTLLQGVDLSFAQLQQANLHEAQLQKASLLGAKLQKANLGYAQLQKASIEWAEMQETKLNDAQLQQASLGGASCEKPAFLGPSYREPSSTLPI